MKVSSVRTERSSGSHSARGLRTPRMRVVQDRQWISRSPRSPRSAQTAPPASIATHASLMMPRLSLPPREDARSEVAAKEPKDRHTNRYEAGEDSKNRSAREAFSMTACELEVALAKHKEQQHAAIDMLKQSFEARLEQLSVSTKICSPRKQNSRIPKEMLALKEAHDALDSAQRQQDARTQERFEYLESCLKETSQQMETLISKLDGLGNRVGECERIEGQICELQEAQSNLGLSQRLTTLISEFGLLGTRIDDCERSEGRIDELEKAHSNLSIEKFTLDEQHIALVDRIDCVDKNFKEVISKCTSEIECLVQKEESNHLVIQELKERLRLSDSARQDIKNRLDSCKSGASQVIPSFIPNLVEPGKAANLSEDIFPHMSTKPCEDTSYSMEEWITKHSQAFRSFSEAFRAFSTNVENRLDALERPAQKTYY